MSASNEARKFFLAEMAHYVSGKDLSVWLLNELYLWVSSGRSVYDNPWALTGENGGTLDYLSAKQIISAEKETPFSSYPVQEKIEDTTPCVVFTATIKNNHFDSQTLVFAKDETDARNKVFQKYKDTLRGFLHNDDITISPFVETPREDLST